MEQEIINILFGAILTIVGWFFRELWANQQKHKEDLWAVTQKIKEDLSVLPQIYVSRQDYREDLKDVKDMLAKIFEKLDNKQDKDK
jgi:Tfp pilus assembly protein PilO